jgi:hypothetical protein
LRGTVQGGTVPGYNISKGMLLCNCLLIPKIESLALYEIVFFSFKDLMATSTLPRISTGPKKVKFFNKQLEKIYFFFFIDLYSSCPRDIYKPDICRYVLVCLMPGKEKKSLKLKFKKLEASLF